MAGLHVPNWHPERDPPYVREFLSRAVSGGELVACQEELVRLLWKAQRIPRRTALRLILSGALGYYAERYAAVVWPHHVAGENDPQSGRLLQQALALRSEGMRPTDILKLGPVVEWLRQMRLEEAVPPFPGVPTWAACRFLDQVLTEEDVRLILEHARHRACRGEPCDAFILRRAIRWATGNHTGEYLVFGCLGREPNLTDEFVETIRVLERHVTLERQSFVSPFSAHDLATIVGRCLPRRSTLLAEEANEAAKDATLRLSLVQSASGYYDQPAAEALAHQWRVGLRQLRAHRSDPLRGQWYILAVWMLEGKGRVDRSRWDEAERVKFRSLWSAANMAIVREAVELFGDPREVSSWACELEPEV